MAEIAKNHPVDQAWDRVMGQIRGEMAARGVMTPWWWLM